MTLRALVLDFDAYFASVEQQLEPELRGRPVAVLPVMADTTCCIAASYEAKAYGIKTGTQVGRAKKMCPDLICVHARHEQYIEHHERLVKAVEGCIPVEEVMSIDEMACSLTGSWREPERALSIARQIKAAIADNVGEYLKCSIGIAPNRFLAKIATKMDKPDGLTLIRQEDLPQALYSLELDDLYGVGRRTRERLNRFGIRSVRDLYAASESKLARAWGNIGGRKMYAALRGEPVPTGITERGSIGHSHVLPPQLRDDASALAVLHRLLQKAAWRLRKAGYCAGGLGLSLRYVDGGRWHPAVRFEPTADTLALGRVMSEVYKQRPQGRMLLGVGVALIRLMEAGQLPLFAEEAARTRLNRTVDAVNTQFGKNAVYFGGAHYAQEEAPMRIAFTHVPDLETEL